MSNSPNRISGSMNSPPEGWNGTEQGGVGWGGVQCVMHEVRVNMLTKTKKDISYNSLIVEICSISGRM